MLSNSEIAKLLSWAERVIGPDDHDALSEFGLRMTQTLPRFSGCPTAADYWRAIGYKQAKWSVINSKRKRMTAVNEEIDLEEEQIEDGFDYVLSRAAVIARLECLPPSERRAILLRLNNQPVLGADSKYLSRGLSKLKEIFSLRPECLE